MLQQPQQNNIKSFTMLPSSKAQASTMVMQWLESDTLIEIDKNKVCDYVKSGLFERVIFIWNNKVLDIGKKLHADYLANCKGLLADGQLEQVSDEVAKMYMNVLWDNMTQGDLYNKWMSAKTSNTHQAIQNNFMSKSN